MTDDFRRSADAFYRGEGPAFGFAQARSEKQMQILRPKKAGL